jgi:hypothetical protein
LVEIKHYYLQRGVENDGSHLTKLNTICSNCCVASDINVRKLFSLQTRKVNCVGVKGFFFGKKLLLMFHCHTTFFG